MNTDVVQSPPGPERDSLLAVYEEICRSYHAIDDFRMKLLGLLPFTSLAAILLLERDDLLVATSAGGSELLGFASVFAAAFTATLFMYEIRGILRCDGLIRRGQHIEEQLHIKGQFFQCAHDANEQKSGPWPKRITGFFNTTVTACLVYSVVFAAWVFLALRWGYGLQAFSCAIVASVVGILLGGLAYQLVRRVVPA